VKSRSAAADPSTRRDASGSTSSTDTAPAAAARAHTTADRSVTPPTATKSCDSASPRAPGTPVTASRISAKAATRGRRRRRRAASPPAPVTVARSSDERVGAEVLARRFEGDQVMAERAREDVLETLGRPSLGVVDGPDRARLGEDEDLLAPNAEDLTGDAPGGIAGQVDPQRADVPRATLLDP